MVDYSKWDTMDLSDDDMDEAMRRDISYQFARAAFESSQKVKAGIREDTDSDTDIDDGNSIKGNDDARSNSHKNPK